MWTHANKCDCFFCRSGKVHPDRKYHQEFRRISSVLKVAESLNPDDYIDLEACVTCSHTRIVEKS